MHQIQQIFCKKKGFHIWNCIILLRPWNWDLELDLHEKWHHCIIILDLLIWWVWCLPTLNTSFVLEHIAKLNLYMRSYLKQVEFWFLSAFRFWKSAHLIQFLYFVSDESGFVEPLLRPFNGRSVSCAIYRSFRPWSLKCHVIIRLESTT